jgi:hypothetical protein
VPEKRQTERKVTKNSFAEEFVEEAELAEGRQTDSIAV